MPNLIFSTPHRSPTPSQEDYLEAIYELQHGGQPARLSAIAARLGVRRSSVSEAMRALVRRGWIRHEAYGRAVLTPRGQRIARRTVERHRVFRAFFEALGFRPREADRAACLMEHVAPSGTEKRLAKWLMIMRPRIRTTLPLLDDQ